MSNPAVKCAETNKSKGATYSALIGKYNIAMKEGYYGEAELIVYAFLEDRLRSFIYYSDLIDTFRSNNLNENGVAAFGCEANIKNISSKISAIRSAFKIMNKPVSEQTDFEKHLCRAYHYSIDRREFKSKLNKIEKWCNYRNEIVHAMFNKDIDALREGFSEHVENGFSLARYVDEQVKHLKNA